MLGNCHVSESAFLATGLDAAQRLEQKQIFREKGNPSLHLFVDENYFNSPFEEYGITRGSTAFPDIR